MTINGVRPVGATTTQQQASSSTQPQVKGLDQDAFMMLLLAQLKNQDPLKPMEDKDFIAQLAQFNSLSQLTQMNETLNNLIAAQTLTEASALIGKTVSGLTSEGDMVTGLVSGLHVADGKVTLDVEGRDVMLDTVQSVQVPGSQSGG